MQMSETGHYVYGEPPRPVKSSLCWGVCTNIVWALVTVTIVAAGVHVTLVHHRILSDEIVVFGRYNATHQKCLSDPLPPCTNTSRPAPCEVIANPLALKLSDIVRSIQFDADQLPFYEFVQSVQDYAARQPYVQRRLDVCQKNESHEQSCWRAWNDWSLTCSTAKQFISTQNPHSRTYDRLLEEEMDHVPWLRGTIAFVWAHWMWLTPMGIILYLLLTFKGPLTAAGWTPATHLKVQ